MNNDEVAKFFRSTSVRIHGNNGLREPQILAYDAVREHLGESTEPSYVQLPVGCGKTGLMGLIPFGVASGRVLVLVPNLTIAKTVADELDISRPDCFYLKAGVFKPKNGPFMTVLKKGANESDCENAHFVVGNIQQFSAAGKKWYSKFPRDYFTIILVDEGHHNVADSWQELFAHFSSARVVSFTATPQRADGRRVLGKRVFSYSYRRSMLMGFISPVDAVWVKPEKITFTAEGDIHEYTLEQVLEMRENDRFSKGIALSEECNRHIVQASIKQLHEVRSHGTPRQIIAVACSIRHAHQIAGLYHEYNFKVEVIHGEQTDEERQTIEKSLRSGLLDGVVQVRLLGEGYSLGTLSVAAVFRPFRSLSPYVQFVGRVLRLADPTRPSSRGNKAYVVSHIGLNDERWWTDFTEFDQEDREFFADLAAGDGEPRNVDGEDGSPRLSLRPFMKVLNEEIESYIQKGYLKEVDEAALHGMLDNIRSQGFDPAEFGLTEDMLRLRLQMSAGEREVPAFVLPPQPQREKEALRARLYKETRSIADVVVNRLGLKHQGRDLLRLFGGHSAPNNTVILISLASGMQNKVIGDDVDRDDATKEQFRAALDASADIADKLTALIKGKLEEKSKKPPKGKPKEADASPDDETENEAPAEDEAEPSKAKKGKQSKVAAKKRTKKKPARGESSSEEGD